MTRSAFLTWLVGSIALSLSVGCGDDANSTAPTKTKDAGTSSAGKSGGRAGKGGSSSAGKGGSGGAGTSTTDAGKVSTGQGDALDAPEDGTWTWIDFPNAFCRDGSTAGLAISRHASSKKVMIFLQGGGACFDALTCGMNPANVSGQTDEQTAGVFDRGNAENPVKDWNFVYVPYCTGDVHAGTNDQGMVAGVTGTQHFVGRRNIEAFLARVVPTFPDADQVLLTGVSAGGFGAAANTDVVRKAFAPIPVTTIDDSGPAMSTTYVPECLQDKWRTTWGFDNSILKDCGSDCPNKSDYDVDFSIHIAKGGGSVLGGLIESSDDSVITQFYGFGANNCTTIVPVQLTADQFTAGLLEYRQKAMDAGVDRFGTYFVKSTQHTWIAGPAFYTTMVQDVRMVDWFKDIVTGTKTANVGP